MKLAALYSGGKDSTYAMMKAIEEGHEIVKLVTIVPEKDDSYMFHHPCIELTKLQAEAMGIEQIMKNSSGEKEKELEDLRAVLENLKDEIDGVVTGAVSSEYQKKRIDKICDELGLKSIAPIWNMDAVDVLENEVNADLEVLIVAVATGSLDKSWLGRRLNGMAVEELKLLSKKNPFNVQFEGGEAESFVLNCPLFKKKVKIENIERVWDDSTSSGYIIVKDAILVSK